MKDLKCNFFHVTFIPLIFPPAFWAALRGPRPPVWKTLNWSNKYWLCVGKTALYCAAKPAPTMLPSEWKVTHTVLLFVLIVGGATLPQNLKKKIHLNHFTMFPVFIYFTNVLQHKRSTYSWVDKNFAWSTFCQKDYKYLQIFSAILCHSFNTSFERVRCKSCIAIKQLKVIKLW